MRVFRFVDDGEVYWGVDRDGETFRVRDLDLNAITKGAEGERLELSELKLLPPVLPGKIVGVGRNYAAHAKELGNEAPAEPLLFLKPPSALLPPGGRIQIPAVSEQVDYEGELAIVIANRARHVRAADWRDYVLGFTCANDVTARDIQKRDVQFTRAKSFDTFCPLGPWIETELDPSDVAVVTRVNGAIRQQGRTSQMVFPAPQLIEYISGIMTLEPGDVILTGTPAGVGPLREADVVEVDIEGIGVLRNTVVDETAN
jgi:2-keto-4-pentenoate hydratase/2-oxohepta-3-ene-1,7-dioic acid hydratase in catechol pathway